MHLKTANSVIDPYSSKARTAHCGPLAVAALSLVFIAKSSLAAAVASKDAYINIDDQNKTIALGTRAVQQKIELSNGRYLLRSFRNLLTGEEYVSPGSISSEFRLTVNGAVVDGNSGDWRWISANAKVLSQGEIEATVKLQRNMLEVEKHYLVYPGTSIIRQWVVFKNQGKTAIEVSDPYFLNHRLLSAATSSQTLYYITGGGIFSGSQILRQAPLTQDYARSFDTADKPEVQKVEGVVNKTAASYGSGKYMPWFGIGNGESKGGLFIGLDYYGRWVADIGNFQNSAGYLGLRLGGYTKSLPPGGSIETPKALTGVWSGDLDEMGNELKNWQYAYLWDYTNDDYFGKIRFAAEMRALQGVGSSYGGGTQDNWDYRMAALLHAADVIRYVGADILWQDAGWHNYVGDNDGPDFRKIQQYIGKSGVRLAVWWPLWYVEKNSKIHQQHPEWGGAGVFEVPLDASRPDVMQWMTDQLDRKIAEWGDFQWRQDGSAVNAVGEPLLGDKPPVDSRLLDQYHNVMKMHREFLERHPKSSVDLCAGGGHLLGFEGLRLSDVGQLTDGGSMKYGAYYTSYLFPPDKLDEWTRTQNATPVNIATTLTMAPAWMGDRGLYGHEPGLSLNGGKEKLRKTFEIYHYLFREGVAGRWVQIYHPKVEGDDPIHYMQRLSRDRKRGVIVINHFTEGRVRIYPKGLNPTEMYDLSFNISKAKAKRSGEDLARNGITLFNPQPLELIYLGLPNHPGSGTDTVAPSEPGQVTKRVGTNVGVVGVELQWAVATDNNWLSYYQIYRDGKPIDRVSKGSFYFDHSLDANPGSVYHVQAVDGDGNSSAMTEAKMSDEGTEVYTARGGYGAGKDYSYQGANHWSYERWKGAERNRLTWNGGLGQQGLYQGSPGDHQLLIGASWMRPSNDEDAVRLFTFPRSGQVRITGKVHKDIYHLKGDGVRVKIMNGSRQLWPRQGWATLSASDVKGTNVDLPLQANAGDQLFFIVNSNSNSTDDETVWDPHVTYTTPQNAVAPGPRTVLDEVDHDIQYTGPGWQTGGTPPWANHFLGDDIGYLEGRYKGTLSMSANPGDKMQLTFRGTGIYLIGETGSDRGMAEISIDGQSKGLIDTFVPESYGVMPSENADKAVLLPRNVPLSPPTTLWGIQGLPDGQHTFELTVSKERNAKSTGNFIAIDKVVVDGATVSQP